MLESKSDCKMGIIHHITQSQAHVTFTLPRSGSAILLNMAGLTSISVGWHPVPVKVSISILQKLPLNTNGCLDCQPEGT